LLEQNNMLPMRGWGSMDYHLKGYPAIKKTTNQP
jgi:hypothetical protein